MRYDDIIIILFYERFNISAISFLVSHLKGTSVCSFELFKLAQPNTSRYKPLISLQARAPCHRYTWRHLQPLRKWPYLMGFTGIISPPISGVILPYLITVFFGPTL